MEQKRPVTPQEDARRKSLRPPVVTVAKPHDVTRLDLGIVDSQSLDHLMCLTGWPLSIYSVDSELLHFLVDK